MMTMSRRRRMMMRREEEKGKKEYNNGCRNTNFCMYIWLKFMLWGCPCIPKVLHLVGCMQSIYHRVSRLYK